jgi:hypothetical protein
MRVFPRPISTSAAEAAVSKHTTGHSRRIGPLVDISLGIRSPSFSFLD